MIAVEYSEISLTLRPWTINNLIVEKCMKLRLEEGLRNTSGAEAQRSKVILEWSLSHLLTSSPVLFSPHYGCFGNATEIYN